MGVCEEGQPRSDLEGNVADLQDKWEGLKKLFGDLNEKLTAALVQVREAVPIGVLHRHFV